MKKLLLSLFLSAGALFAQAQEMLKLDSVVTPNRTKYIHTYEENGWMLSKYYGWNPLTSSWTLTNARNYQFIGNEEITIESSLFSGYQYLLPYRKTVLIYDAERTLIERREYNRVQNLWSAVNRYTLVEVDSASHFEYVHELWNIDLNAWEFNTKEEYWVNPSGKTIETISYRWINNAWSLFNSSPRRTYAYDENDNMISLEYYTWQPPTSTWRPGYQQVFTYYPDGSVATRDTYLFDADSGTWVFHEKRYENINVYSTEGRLVEKIYREWNSSAADLVNSTKETFEYDSEGNITDYSRYRWDRDLEVWYGFYMEMNTYDLSVDPADLVYPQERDYPELFRNAKLDYRETYALNADLNDWELDSETWYYFSELVTATHEASAEETLKLFPNPVSNLLTPGANAPRTSSYQITDLNGRVLQYEKSWNGDGIDVSRLIPGSYFIKLIEGNRVITGKFIKL